MSEVRTCSSCDLVEDAGAWPDQDGEGRCVSCAAGGVEPCEKCGVLMDRDVWLEELRMCLDCSNRFWDHGKDGHECSWACVATAGMPEERV